MLVSISLTGERQTDELDEVISERFLFNIDLIHGDDEHLAESAGLRY